MWRNTSLMNIRLNIYLHFSHTHTQKKNSWYVQNNCKKWSTLCICECVGLLWTVWQCGFAPVWLNLAQCVHKSFISSVHMLRQGGFCSNDGAEGVVSSCLIQSPPLPAFPVSLSFSFFLPVKFSFSLHFHTTVLTEGSDRLSWPVISVGYGYRWGRKRKGKVRANIFA